MFLEISGIQINSYSSFTQAVLSYIYKLSALQFSLQQLWLRVNVTSLFLNFKPPQLLNYLISWLFTWYPKITTGEQNALKKPNMMWKLSVCIENFIVLSISLWRWFPKCICLTWLEIIYSFNLNGYAILFFSLIF